MAQRLLAARGDQGLAQAEKQPQPGRKFDRAHGLPDNFVGDAQSARHSRVIGITIEHGHHRNGQWCAPLAKRAHRLRVGLEHAGRDDKPVEVAGQVGRPRDLARGHPLSRKPPGQIGRRIPRKPKADDVHAPLRCRQKFAGIAYRSPFPL